MKSLIAKRELEQSTAKSVKSSSPVPLEEAKKSFYSSSCEERKMSKMQNRSKMINKLALILLSIVVLELVLIGNQVQPVKAIKKKIYLKKLKKLLPLLALVKPKKKIILVPIPIPMFKNSGHHANPHYYQHHQHRPEQPVAPPMSFMMMNQDTNSGEPNFVGVSMDGVSSGLLPMMNLPPNVGSNFNGDPFANMPQATTPAPVIVTTTSTTPPTASVNSSSQPGSMMLPSMTMTIQSEPGGNSAIELSTNMVGANSSSGALLQRPQGNKWLPQKEQQQQFSQQEDQFDEPVEQQQQLGEQYYSSPWINRGAPLASPAKVFRNDRLRIQPQQPRNMQTFVVAPPRLQPAQRQASQQTSVMLNTPTNLDNGQFQMPVLLIKNQWRPGVQQSGNLNLPVAVLAQQQQQAVKQALEYEELVPIGPPQMMPVYQTANGQLHMSPPPPVMIQPVSQPGQQVQQAQTSTQTPQFEREEPTGREPSGETLNNGPIEPLLDSQRTSRQQQQVVTSKTTAKLSSPAIKGKQQTKQKSASSGGY